MNVTPSSFSSRAFAILGALLAAGLIVFGFQLGNAVQRGRDFDRYLTVRGLSERDVKATLALWPLKYAVAADDLPALRQRLEQDRLRVVEFLAQQGFSPEEIHVGMPGYTDRIDRPGFAESAGIPRYGAVGTLLVRSKKVDAVKAATQKADQLLAAGVSLAHGEYGDRAEFIFEDLNDVKPSMIEEATANARASAVKFAEDSKARVGSIRRATQGFVEINDRDAASPEIKSLRVVTTVEFFIER